MKEFKKMNDDERKDVKDVIAEAIKAVGGEVPTDLDERLDKDSTNVSNTFVIGKTYDIVGLVMATIVDNKTKKVTSTFPALETTEGVNISLRNFIKYSPRGYETSGEFTQDTDGNGGNAKKFKAEVDSAWDGDEKSLFMTAAKNPLLLFYEWTKNPTDIPRAVTLVGKVCRPWVAQKASKGGFEDYKKNANRVMRLNLWTEG